MKTEIILLPGVILIINIINVNCIVPKYLQNIERPLVRTRTYFEDIPSYTKMDEILLPAEEKTVYRYLNKEPSIKLQSKYGYPNNIIDSVEVDKNAPVEDFDDYSVEENKIAKPSKHISIDKNESNSAKETFGDSNERVRSRHKRNVFETNKGNIKTKLSKMRQKRMPALYTGRYKSQDVDDILNLIPEVKSKSNITDKKLKVETNAISNEHTAKERSRRNTKNIIEEENLATTIAGFKFTGGLYFLNNDLSFKNIHS